MSYEPLALKYRPRRFEDVVGQGPQATTLRNAVVRDRVANAFLFSGSRGVGKTSMARILAKALNCKNADQGEPCGACEICEAIARGEDLDVIEIDGASNRGIDEIRSIRDNAGYAPTRSAYKIYIIDEVHMLTLQAFNALLKTLEEPPPHVRFIFATTEPQAVPETIVSRCQRYEFRRIPKPQIAERLASICAAEGVSCAASVLDEIADKSEGGLRDSLSLLDHLIAFAGNSIAEDDLEKILGHIDAELLLALIEASGAADERATLDALDAIFDTGRDAEDILVQMVETLREAMVRMARGLPGGGEGRRARVIEAIAAAFSMDRILLTLRLCLNARREIKMVGQGRLQLELTFLKVARSQNLVSVQELLSRLDSVGPVLPAAAPTASAPAQRSGEDTAAPTRWRAPSKTAPIPGRVPSPPKPAPPPATAAEPVARAAKAAAPRVSTPAPEPGLSAAPPGAASKPPRIEQIRELWGRVLNDLRDESPRAAAFVEEGRPSALKGSTIEIAFPPGKDFARRQLEGALAASVRAGLSRTFGHPLSFRCVEGEAVPGGALDTKARSVYEDKDVRKVLDSFEGGVISVEERGDSEQ